MSQSRTSHQKKSMLIGSVCMLLVTRMIGKGIRWKVMIKCLNCFLKTSSSQKMLQIISFEQLSLLMNFLSSFTDWIRTTMRAAKTILLGNSSAPLHHTHPAVFFLESSGGRIAQEGMPILCSTLRSEETAMVMKMQSCFSWMDC